MTSLNNSSISDSMTIHDVLRAADDRARRMNADANTPTGTMREGIEAEWTRLVNSARAVLPASIAPYVVEAFATNRDDFPTGLSVAIDLPGAERIHFGPWAYDTQSKEFEIAGPWKNKPFEVGGGNREEFGDLLDAIARAREVFRTRYAR